MQHMPKDSTIHKVVILGSGPIIIGQAAEFDYSGTQACNAMREEGIETVLINSNPATIMTDREIADIVYIDPLTVSAVTAILEKERPDGLLAGFGGQTALNIAMELHQSGVLERLDVRLLGIHPDSIRKAEDREEFKDLMDEIGEPIAPSVIVHTLEESAAFAKTQGYPIIVRPAYTLGGTGGGIAHSDDQLHAICSRGLALSPIHQLLLEESLTGYKEIEYEVMRDAMDNCIIVCNMENFDPVGVHTGDSIVIAPSQTLTDKQYQMLRNAAFKIIRALKIEGGCNIQYALDPDSDDYRVIEVNPRVSRSSALASKATGYPIAKVASKVAVGYALHELKNSITKSSSAFFEPSLDYVVVKIPKLPFDKFPTSAKTLGTQMKATGEVMSIGRTYEEALLKAIRSLESGVLSLDFPAFDTASNELLIEKLTTESFDKLFAMAQLLRRGVGIETIFNLTKVDRWFLRGLENIVKVQEALKRGGADALETAVVQAGKYGMPVAEIARLSGWEPGAVTQLLESRHVRTVYKMVDTCSSEFDAATSYYYSCVDEEDESIPLDREKILVIGSGPIRIGQGIEFDYCCVHGVWAIKEAGYYSVIINNNPETVSTDFDTADKLYLEPLFIEDVMRVIEKEKPSGVVVQLGGQTAINLSRELHARGVRILGTSFESIDKAEDREKFNEVLRSINISFPQGYMACTLSEVDESIEKLGYPVMIRPSYVIGGRAMQIIHTPRMLRHYLENNREHLQSGGLLIDKYIQGKEVEVDAVCDGEHILIPGIMEHIERTGVHSGDSISVYPAAFLAHDVVETLVDYTGRIGRALDIRGIFNIQYVYDGREVRVIEVNPRASRTVPILSKLTGVPMVKLATRVMLGETLPDLGYGTGLYKKAQLFGVKIPIFSNEKLIDVDIAVGPEMRSTGEVLGVDADLDAAIYKAFEAAGANIVSGGNLFVALDDTNKEEGVQLVREYCRRNFHIYSGGQTAEHLRAQGIPLQELTHSDLMQALENGKIQLLLNTPTRGGDTGTFGFRLRRRASEYKVQAFTCLDTARFFLKAIDEKKHRTADA